MILVPPAGGVTRRQRLLITFTRHIAHEDGQEVHGQVLVGFAASKAHLPARHVGLGLTELMPADPTPQPVHTHLHQPEIVFRSLVFGDTHSKG